MSCLKKLTKSYNSLSKNSIRRRAKYCYPSIRCADTYRGKRPMPGNGSPCSGPNSPAYKPENRVRAAESKRTNRRRCRLRSVARRQRRISEYRGRSNARNGSSSRKSSYRHWDPGSRSYWERRSGRRTSLRRVRT